MRTITITGCHMNIIGKAVSKRNSDGSYTVSFGDRVFEVRQLRRVLAKSEDRLWAAFEKGRFEVVERARTKKLLISKLSGSLDRMDRQIKLAMQVQTKEVK